MQQFLESWFAECSDGKAPALESVSMDTRAYWHAVLAQCKAGMLDSWQKTPPGRLALIILMGQLANLLEDSDCYKLNQKAKRLCLYGVEQGFDTQLDVMQRRYFYEPLFASSEAKDRDLLQRLLSGMRALAAEESLNTWQGWYHQARMSSIHA
ncbi:DUF924 family protein [Shewanella gelidii]|uniref:DUF924 domain-containing protein n=1 Tax=Shewanella gelidii TaxID=1642821 RepID=A0A917N765_9GAMM|nr:DUF924 family protein [Shewanella gelidii]MCL1097209.1 DUF924 family protein [Shewanella gelidii]GGI73312.1 hypothetical protein GCM10009332_08550 [Shewanella gelidii]